MNSPIPWAGGKARLAKHILPHIQDHICWCEPFAGGLGMLFNKDPSTVEVINDNHKDLVNLFRVAKYHPEALIDELDLVPYSREEFNHLRLADHSQKTDVQRAAWFFQSIDLSFGGMGTKGGFGYGRTHGPIARSNYLIKIQTLCARLDKAIIENLDYTDILQRYDATATFFFIDPPYIGGGQKLYESWTLEDLQNLRDRLRTLKGGWMVTMSSGPDVESVFDGCTITQVERQNGIENRKGSGRKYQELIIMPKVRSVKKS